MLIECPEHHTPLDDGECAACVRGDKPLCAPCQDEEHECCRNPVHASRPDWENGEVRVIVCCCDDGPPERDWDYIEGGWG